MSLALSKKSDPSATRLTHVVHVAGQLTMGGLEKLLVEFARHSNRNSFNHHFVSLGDGGQPAEELEALGCRVILLKASRGVRFSLIPKLRNILRSLPTDVVHTHNTRSLLYAVPATRFLRVKRFIHTQHGQDQTTRGLAKTAAGFALKFVDKVVCVSRDNASLATAAGLRQNRISTIWNGIDTARFNHICRDNAGPAVSVGRLSIEKDYSTLIHAVQIIAKKYPSFRLLIAGDGPERTRLTELVAKLELSSHVRLLGETKDIPALLAGASLFINSSLTEGISLGILEGMAAGLPVVATSVGGTPEIIESGVNGILVPPADAQSLAEAILTVFESHSQGTYLGQNGRLRVTQRFSVDRMIQAYEQLYLGNDSVSPSLP